MDPDLDIRNPRPAVGRLKLASPTKSVELPLRWPCSEPNLGLPIVIGSATAAVRLRDDVPDEVEDILLARRCFDIPAGSTSGMLPSRAKTDRTEDAL